MSDKIKLLKYTKENAKNAVKDQVFLKLFEDEDKDPCVCMVDSDACKRLKRFYDHDIS